MNYLQIKKICAEKKYTKEEKYAKRERTQQRRSLRKNVIVNIEIKEDDYFIYNNLYIEKIINMFLKILEKMNLVQLCMDNYLRQ